MPDPVPPANPSATVLRRIHKNDFDPRRQPPFLRGAFNPGSQDSDGLSVYVEGEKGTTPESLAAGGRKPGEYYVVRFTTSELAAIGVSVVATPELDPDTPGHCSLPELSAACKASTPEAVKELQVRLTELAADRIVVTPTA